MKLKTTLSLFMILLASALMAQNYVSTEPLNKNAILEEFTGVSCPNCPAGHTTLANILAANPDRAFAVAYHPSNSSFTTPYPGDPDFRRTYPNAFYSTPYCGSSRFMPSAFIQRRIYGADRLQSRTVWANYANTIMTEASPANMGMATTYSMMNQILYITVEIYYTDDMTDDNHIYVMLSENDLVSQQSGASGPYTHKHTFREAFVGQWGDLITEPTTQGSLVTLEYEWNTAGSGYAMSNCEVLAFIENQATGEIITGVGVHVGDQTYIEPTAAFSVEDNTIGVGGQAIFTDESTGGPATWEWTFEGGDPATSTWPSPGAITYNTPGQYDVTLTVTNPAGTNTTTMTNFVDVDYAPVADFSANVTYVNVGGSVDFTDVSINSPTVWEWTFEGGTPETSSDQNPVGITYNSMGSYDVVLVATNEYGSDTLTRDDFIDVGNIGIDESTQQLFSVYPNPSNGNLYIKSVQHTYVQEIVVRSLNGQLVLSQKADGSIIQKLDLSSLNTGMYFVEIRTADAVYLEKVILK